MKQYLVVIRCGMDDIPVRIFGDSIKAVKFAQTLGGSVESLDPYCKIIGVDISFPAANVSLYTFDRGVLANVSILKVFNDEE